MSKKETKTKEPKSLIQKWTEWLTGWSKSRPSNEFSYGKGMDRVSMKLPKSVEEQLKMVNVMQMLDQYPYDYKLKLEFFNMIAPYGTTLNQPVSLELLGYAGTETYILLYQDMLLRPLSQGAANMFQEIIQEILPASSAE